MKKLGILIICIALLLACGDRNRNENTPNNPPNIATPTPPPPIPLTPDSRPASSAPISQTPISEIFEKYLDTNIPLGCSKVSVSGIPIHQGALSSTGKTIEQFSQEIRNTYGIPIKGEGVTLQRLQIIANVIQEVQRFHPGLRPSDIYIYGSHEEFLRRTGQRRTTRAVTQRDNPRHMTFSPTTFESGLYTANWIVTHEFGHLTHGTRVRDPEGVANTFATLVRGYNKQSAFNPENFGTPV